MSQTCNSCDNEHLVIMHGWKLFRAIWVHWIGCGGNLSLSGLQKPASSHLVWYQREAKPQIHPEALFIVVMTSTTGQASPKVACHSILDKTSNDILTNKDKQSPNRVKLSPMLDMNPKVETISYHLNQRRHVCTGLQDLSLIIQQLLAHSILELLYHHHQLAISIGGYYSGGHSSITLVEEGSVKSSLFLLQVHQ